MLRYMCCKIVGACMAMHNELGYAFLEHAYQETLALEFPKHSTPFPGNII